MKLRKDSTLILDKEDLGKLLIKITRGLTRKINNDEIIRTSDLIEIFDWKLSELKWDANLEDYDHKNILIKLESSIQEETV